MRDTVMAGGGSARSTALYRAVWRWHFLAGLIVLPFVILIAATGGIYLFKDEYNRLTQGHLRFVAPVEGETLAPSRIAAAALEAYPGTLVSYAPPAAPDRSAMVGVQSAQGPTDNVFVDPHDGRVLGLAWDAGPSGSAAIHVIRKLHSLDYAGWWANRVIEAVAGWMVLLVGTGIYLWWPRGRTVGVFRPRAATGRARWRDIHAVTGAYAAIFIVFLALTGLPWSGVWGKAFYDLSHAAGLGVPDGYWARLPVSSVPTGAALDRAPWIMERAPMPVSEPRAAAPEGVPAVLDSVVRRVEARGIHPGYIVTIPTEPRGVFTASVYPDDITQERVIHLDRYSGAVLLDMGLADLGPLGRAAEWGVSLHMGQAFGRANQIVLALACAAMILMSVAAMAMWWARRPAGRLGTPPLPADWRIPRGVLVMALAAGIVFPLVGLSLLVVAAIEIGLSVWRWWAVRPARSAPPERGADGA